MKRSVNVLVEYADDETNVLLYFTVMDLQAQQAWCNSKFNIPFFL
jgi:hypothetical protein